ncbi:MAG: hypothetical protein AAF401_14685 [Pseudomonadota bacterium]
MEIASDRWLVNLGARASYRGFDDPGLANPTVTRDDVDFRVHLSHEAYLQDNLSILARAEYFRRESNIRNFDLDAITLKVGARLRF